MQRGTLELLRFANFNLDICTYKQQQQIKKPKNVLVNVGVHSNNA